MILNKLRVINLQLERIEMIQIIQMINLKVKHLLYWVERIKELEQILNLNMIMINLIFLYLKIKMSELLRSTNSRQKKKSLNGINISKKVPKKFLNRIL